METLSELLKQNTIAYVKETAFYPRNADEVWVSMLAEATAVSDGGHNIPVKYSTKLPGVLANVPIDYIKKFSTGLNYDLVGYHIKMKSGLFLPVLGDFSGQD